MGEYEKAEALSGRAPFLVMMQAIIYYSIGDSYFNMGKYDDAITNYDKVLTLYPKSNYVFDAVNGLQYSYVAQGKPQKAISAKASEYNPWSTAVEERLREHHK